MRRQIASCLGLLTAFLTASVPNADAKPTGILRDAKIDDKPTALCFPVSSDECVVFSLPEHGWIVSVAHGGTPRSLDGEGVFLEWIPNYDNGGAAARAFLGTVPLPAANAGEAPPARLERAERWDELVAALERC